MRRTIKLVADVETGQTMEHDRKGHHYLSCSRCRLDIFVDLLKKFGGAAQI